MENALILTYYYPPCKGVSAYRPLSWAKDFHKFGFHPTIITRSWTGNETRWEDYLQELEGEIVQVENPTSEIIYLPYKKNRFLQLAEKKWAKTSYFNKLIFLYLSLSGKLQPEIDAYSTFKAYVEEELQKKKYKFIIVTSPPMNLIRLAYEMNKKFNIPFIVDFQDSFNNLMLGEKYDPGMKEKFLDFSKQTYLNKWLKRASFSITVTPSIGDLIKKITSKPVEIITNGFEMEAYLSKEIIPSDSVFTISVMGTINPIQDISAMLEGLNLFLKGKDPGKLRLNFIGLDSFPEMAHRITIALPAQFIKISPRVSMEKAVEHTMAANILLFPSYKGYKGYYTAKIFEYLGAGRNILMIPGNNDIVDELIIKTGSGKIANSSVEFAAILENWHKEWQESGTIQYYGVKEHIQFFSRENQNKLFCEAIQKYIP